MDIVKETIGTVYGAMIAYIKPKYQALLYEGRRVRRQIGSNYMDQYAKVVIGTTQNMIVFWLRIFFSSLMRDRKHKKFFKKYGRILKI